MSNGIDKRVCKICLVEHLRIFSNKVGKNSFYRDEHGILWNGKICGVCNRTRLRGVMAKNRDVDDGSGIFIIEAQPKKEGE